MPPSISPLSSISGSYSNPFQPVRVRGFSKYARMTISSSPESSLRTDTRRSAYASAARVSCMEHGPTTTSSRSLCCRIICRIAQRDSAISACACAVPGNSFRIWSGVGIASAVWPCAGNALVIFRPSCLRGQLERHNCRPSRKRSIRLWTVMCYVRLPPMLFSRRASGAIVGLDVNTAMATATPTICSAIPVHSARAGQRCS